MEGSSGSLRRNWRISDFLVTVNVSIMFWTTGTTQYPIPLKMPPPTETFFSNSYLVKSVFISVLVIRIGPYSYRKRTIYYNMRFKKVTDGTVYLNYSCHNWTHQNRWFTSRNIQLLFSINSKWFQLWLIFWYVNVGS